MTLSMIRSTIPSEGTTVSPIWMCFANPGGALIIVSCISTNKFVIFNAYFMSRYKGPKSTKEHN